MLTILGFAMVATFMVLIMLGRLSPLVALILVPIAFGVLAGAGPGLGPMMLSGVKALAPTAIMLLFAILYFCLMTDAGLFDPLIRRILKLVKGDPLWVLIGTAFIGLVTALDGDGAPTYVICVSALTPIYKRLGLKSQQMATVLMMCVGTMHLVPWGGPTARAAVAMHVNVAEVFVPLLPVMLAGVVYILAAATAMGLQERRRLGAALSCGSLEVDDGTVAGRLRGEKRVLFYFNLALTILLLAAMIADVFPIPILFMIATALALAVNCPSIQRHRDLVAAHSYTALAVVGIVLAAGVFTGILTGSGMLAAMSQSILSVTPSWAGPYLAPATTLVSGPATYLLSNDAFYFGLLPALAKTASVYGITPVQMARASLIGQPLHMLSPLVASTYLLVSLLDLNYGANQYRSVLWVVGLILVMLASALGMGIIPLHASL